MVTPDGRAYVDLYLAGETGLVGQIGLVDREGGVRIVATGLALPNCLGLLPDSTVVVSETNGSRILAYRG